jgi:F420H(2)-dependent quinone reductase
MTISGEYAPSTSSWVRDQVDTIERTGTTTSVHIQNRPVVLLTMLGKASGKVRKVPLMRVEHDGVYAAVASKGGAPDNPQWYANLLAHPDLDLQDDTETRPVRARLISGDERAEWWTRCVEAFPSYAEYQKGTEREIPVFLLEPR